MTQVLRRIRAKSPSMRAKSPERTRSLDIDKQLKQEHRNTNSRPFNSILIAGPENSGKSTLFKQIRLWWEHDGVEFPESFATACREIVLKYLISSLQALCDVLIYRDCNTFCPSSRISQLIALVETNTLQSRSECSSLWKEYQFEQYLEKHRLFLNSEHIHFLSRITDILSEDYVPTRQDILWTKTSHISELSEWHTFLWHQHISVSDVSGVQSDKLTGIPRKVEHLFGDVKTLFFVVDISVYDRTTSKPTSWHEILDDLVPRDIANIIVDFGQVLEDNFLRQVLNAFRELSSRYFRSSNAHVHVFLNKVDIFYSKFSVSEFQACFPEAANITGPRSAVRFLRTQFQGRRGKHLHTKAHVTVLNQVDSTGTVLNAIGETVGKDVIMRHNLRKRDLL